MKPKGRVSTSARVQVTVEVRAGSWGPDCKLDQVYRQASEEAVNKIRRAFQHEHGVRIINVDKVIAVATDMENS